MHPADDDDVPVFEGRFNLGAISLHLPMILAKSRRENKDFYEVLDYYLELIRKLHKKTYDFLGEKKASINPLGFCEGGFYGGHLKPDEKIRPLLKAMTMSFGITALNELNQLYNGKSIYEDGEFPLEVMRHINKRLEEFKEADNILYACYATPAESLCHSGDTMVQTYNGDKAIKDLTTDDLVYSYNEETNKIELKRVLWAAKTKDHAVTVTVKFTNGQKIVCTPEHPFAKRKIVMQPKNGKSKYEAVEYVMAKDLVPGDRIKSNYRIVNIDGHYKFTTEQYEHDINAEYAYGKKPDGYVVHHKNGNKLDNAFENLEYMLDADHRRLHMSQALINNRHTSENQLGEKNSFYGKHHTQKAIEANRAAHIGANNVTSKPVVQLTLDGSIVNEYESRGIAERETGFSNISYACNGKYKAKKDPHEFMGYVWYFKDELEMDGTNHKVESVEYNDDLIPVYNIHVEDNNNFYVGGDDGILVHNCATQVEQFRKEFGIVRGVSDRSYMSNSFHCAVWENITPIQKQDSEERFWDLFNGGKIQYCKYPINYNTGAMKTLIRRAMDKGFYEGVNLSLSYCEDCGYQQLSMDVCPKCGSKLVCKIERMNGLTA